MPAMPGLTVMLVGASAFIASPVCNERVVAL